MAVKATTKARRKQDFRFPSPTLHLRGSVYFWPKLRSTSLKSNQIEPQAILPKAINDAAAHVQIDFPHSPEETLLDFQLAA